MDRSQKIISYNEGLELENVLEARLIDKLYTNELGLEQLAGVFEAAFGADDEDVIRYNNFISTLPRQ